VTGATVVFVALPPAHAASTHRCGSVRIDRELHRSPDGEFGAFGIRARPTGCRRARRLAARYVHDPSFPARLGPWHCTNRTIDSQVARVRCRLDGARVSFRDVIPNG
jgi:hypothetical protein